MNNFVIMILMWISGFLVGFGTRGMLHNMNETNFQKCSVMYETPEDIVECLWILENN